MTKVAQESLQESWVIKVAQELRGSWVLQAIVFFVNFSLTYVVLGLIESYLVGDGIKCPSTTDENDYDHDLCGHNYHHDYYGHN